MSGTSSDTVLRMCAVFSLCCPKHETSEVNEPITVCGVVFIVYIHSYYFLLPRQRRLSRCQKAACLVPAFGILLSRKGCIVRHKLPFEQPCDQLLPGGFVGFDNPTAP